MKPYNNLRNVTKMLIESACQDNNYVYKPIVLYREIATALSNGSIDTTAMMFNISESTVYLINEDMKDDQNIFQKA